MGVDIHCHILKKDNNKWKEIKIYKKEESNTYTPLDIDSKDNNECKEIKIYKKEKNNIYTPLNVYPYRDSELFDLLQDDNIPCSNLDENTLPNELKELIQDQKEWCYGFREINLADLKLYLYNKPKIKDYALDDWKDNPIKNFVNRIISIIEIEDPFYFLDSCFSNIRILIWFDH